jgi:sialic acid synthase SpsE
MQKTFIIAEAGINHNGDIGNVMQQVKIAKLAGADAVKFQLLICTSSYQLLQKFLHFKKKSWKNLND